MAGWYGKSMFKRMVLSWIVTAVSLWVVVQFIGGVAISNFPTLLWTAAVLGLVNVVVRPLLLLITLPLNLLTLGLFTFVINAIILVLVDALVAGFHVASFGTALLAAVLLAIVGGLLNWLIRG